MRGYKISNLNDMWSFELIPGNNNLQNVGWSKLYSSYDECLCAVKQLRNLIVENHIDTLKSPFIRSIENEDGIRVEYYIGNNFLFQTRTYTGASAKANCEKSVRSIYNHIVEYTTKPID